MSASPTPEAATVEVLAALARAQLTPGAHGVSSGREQFRDPADRRCGCTIQGRAGASDGPLRCDYTKGHAKPHRFMAPDATLAWWPADAGDPPAWEDAIHTPATDPRWPCPEETPDA